MKTFLVENRRRGVTIKVTLNQPPYENENILYKTGWKEKDCTITEVYNGYDDEVRDPSVIDTIDIEGEE
tara:strand:+ start:422 stop:628 length:207 start_codon:yes stop_codon:yes gene_type:complete